MKLKRNITTRVVKSKPSRLRFHEPVALCALERDLVKAAIKKRDIDCDLDIDDLLVVEREYTVVGFYSRLITKAKSDSLFEEQMLWSPNFSFEDGDVTAGSIVYLGTDGIDCIEMFSYGTAEFPEDIQCLKYQILKD